MTLTTRHVWAAWGVVGVAMLVTYSRVDPKDLYHVSGSGLVDGGLSRVLVYSNFPVALVAALLGGLAARRLDRRAAGVVCVALCAVVAVPGVVSQSNLDAKWVNAVPALGVAIALALELKAEPQRVHVGRRTLAAVGALGLLSLVWIAAELGFHETFGVFLAGQPRPVEAAVHLGNHHGLDGAMLTATPPHSGCARAARERDLARDPCDRRDRVSRGRASSRRCGRSRRRRLIRR